MMCSILLPIANFDFLSDNILEAVFPLSGVVLESFPFAFEFLGYGHSAVPNMGTVFVSNMY